MRSITQQHPFWPKASAWQKYWSISDAVVFLNHGSFGACPREVLAYQAALQMELEAEPVQFLARHYAERLEQARGVLAEFLGAEAGNIAFVTNATTGVNAVVRSLDFSAGDEILTTSLDYNACRNVLTEVARRSGARLVVAAVPFPLESENQVVSAIVAAVTPRTRLAMIDHVTSDTAMIYPLEKIIQALAQRGVDVLVDGAHAPGMLPLELEKLGAAYYTGNLHKWVGAPKGAAFLWVRPDRQEGIQPVVISHGNNRRRSGHTAFQDRFDWPGTHDPTAWFASAAAIECLGKMLPGGWPELRADHHGKIIVARRHLCERLGISPPCPEEMLGSMATLPMPDGLDVLGEIGVLDPIYQVLFDGYGIELHVIRLGGRRWFRISAHLYNSADDYRYLAEALGEIQASHPSGRS